MQDATVSKYVLLEASLNGPNVDMSGFDKKNQMATAHFNINSDNISYHPKVASLPKILGKKDVKEGHKTGEDNQKQNHLSGLER